MTARPIFATCPRGLENILAQELAAQGCTGIQTAEGGVSARADTAALYRANLHSRTAGRILLQLAHAPYRSEDDLYRLAHNTRWEDWFTAAQTIKIQAEAKRARVKSLEFAVLKTKDGICDRFRSSQGERPSVDKVHPDIRIRLFLDDKTATLYLDTSGEALFKRGYRQNAGAAPLRENLAAGLLLLAGYNGSRPLQDPFCGSGTLAIEAAWIAQNRAPGLMRRFGFEQFSNCDRSLWAKLKAQAREQIRQPQHPISAGDTDRALLHEARANAQAAQAADHIVFTAADALDAEPNGENGLLIANPPYGERLSDSQTLHALYPQFAARLKQYYAGWTAALFSGDMELPRLMRLKPRRKIPLYNGKLDCRLFLFDMVAGSNRN